MKAGSTIVVSPVKFLQTKGKLVIVCMCEEVVPVICNLNDSATNCSGNAEVITRRESDKNKLCES